ncbi:MAG: asparagine synthase [Anaerolineae bacterium]|nr:asparagine synthase [Anaerolineae bacterium]
MSNNRTQFGSFTVFGFTQQPDTFLQYELPTRLQISPRTIDFGEAGHFFLYTSYGEVAENEELIVLKLGLLHSPQGTPLSAQQLLEHKLVKASEIKADELRGNGLVACFSKTAPEFSVYKTLLSTPQLYYSTHSQTILCTDGPRPHLALLDRVEPNEEAVVQHFLFRYALGTHTYYRDIHRLLSGQLLRWQAGTIKLDQVRDLRPEPGSQVFDKINSTGIEALHQNLSGVIGAYLRDMEAVGTKAGTMLSGGVDSVVLQLLVNEYISLPADRKTFSYALRVPNFGFEIEYAKQAAQSLQTDHTFVDVTPEQYPDLLVRTIETLGYPIPAESQPCKLAIAEHLAACASAPHFFFVGTGADTLYGTGLAKKIKLLEKTRNIPFSNLALNSIAQLVQPIAPKKAHGLRQVAGILPEVDQPVSYKIPANTVAVYSDIDMARRSFGDHALQKAFEYRHQMEAHFVGSQHPIEKVLAMELVTDAYETGVLVNHLYLAHQREQVYPYFDEEIIRFSYSFDPDIRYLKGQQVKPLLKGLLEQNSLGSIARKPKGASVFNENLYDWLKSGPLREMVLAMDRPGFVSKSDFEKLIEVPSWSPLDEPNWFLWNLLTFDIFQKHVVRAY